MNKASGAFLALLVGGLVACTAQTGGTISGPGSATLPAIDGDLAVTAALPANTVGEERPSEGLGSVHSAQWDARVGGFTQRHYSEVLAFPPGTKITIRNLSKTIAHTFDVVKVIDGPPARFPLKPALSFSHKGGDKVEAGYASGIIAPGHSVTVILVKGIYLIGCAFHYSEGMRDVLVVEPHEHPGPQATPIPSTPTPAPSSSPSTGPTPSGPTSPSPSTSPTATPLTITPQRLDLCINTTACHGAYPNSAQATVMLNGAPVSVTYDASQCTNYATVSPSSGTGPFTVTGMGTRTWTCYVYFTSGAGDQGSLFVYVWSS